MKKGIAFLFFVVFVGVVGVRAQQIELNTQYMLNKYAYNPAVSGTDEFYQVQLNVRNQWTGFSGAPTTFFASYYGRKERNKTTGLGVSLLSDHAGPTSRTGAMGSYTHHMKVKGESKLALGLSIGIVNYAIKVSDIFVKDDGDKIFANDIASMQPDASFGAYFYNPKYYLGLSVKHMMGSELNWPYVTDSKMAGHFYFIGGYKFKSGEKLVVEPSVLAKYVDPSILQIDGGVMLTYMERMNAGFTYRTAEAMSIIVGYDLKSKMYIGYSYDITTSRLGNFSSGSHEIMLSYRFISVEEEESEMDF